MHRVKNLSATVRLVSKLVRLILEMVASSTFVRLTEAERQAIQALLAALQAFEALLPAPGTDDSPKTTA